MSKSRVIAKKKCRREKKIAPVHPGEVLREDVLKPFGMSVNKLALSLGVPATRLEEIVNGRRAGRCRAAAEKP